MEKLGTFDIATLSKQEVEKKIDLIVEDENWNRIFKQNINTSRGHPQWNFNFDGLLQNMRLRKPDVAAWDASYGLWPGRAWALFASHSPWIHVATNTLPFYDVFPRLQG